MTRDCPDCAAHEEYGPCERHPVPEEGSGDALRGVVFAFLLILAATAAVCGLAVFLTALGD